MKNNDSSKVHFFILYTILFLIGTETFLISPLLPTIASELGESIAAVAAIVTAYVLCYALIAPIFAIIADTMSRNKFILVGGVLFAAGNFLFSASSSLTSLIISRVIAGIGAALTGPSIWAMIADLAPVEHRGRLIGYGMGAFSLGQVIGVPLSGILAQYMGWKTPFFLIGALFSLVLITGFRYLPTIDLTSQPLPLQKKASAIIAPWKNISSLLSFLLIFLFHAANLGSYSFLGAILANRFSLQPAILGSMGILVGLGSVLGATAAGYWGDRTRKRRLSGASHLPIWSILLIVSLFFIATTTAPTTALTIILLWFLASGAFVTDMQTILANMMPTTRALASAWNTSLMHFGTATGVYFIGMRTSPANGILLASLPLAGLSFIISIALMKFLKNKSTF